MRRDDMPMELIEETEREVRERAAANGGPLRRNAVTPIHKEMRAPSFPVHALPKAAKRLVEEAAAAIGCPPDGIALAVLTTLGAAIGNARAIQLKKNWTESAAIYGALIADSGEKKTAAIAVATDPAHRLQNRLNKKHEKALDEFARKEREYEAKKKEAAKEERPAPQPPRKPVAERVHVNDTTTEALISILKENPRGVLQERDELVGWVKAFDQYRSGGKGADRQVYLSTWSNRPVSVDRKGQLEPLAVLRPFISVIGSIQPDVLHELAEGREDGMLERFLFAYPEPRNALWSEDEISDVALALYRELHELLRGLNMGLDDLGDPVEVPVAFSPDAKEVFVEVYDEHRAEMMRPGFPSNLRSPWAKLEAYFARLILILACCRFVGNGDPERIEAEDVLRASVILDYFKGQARRVFGELRGFDPRRRLVEDVAKFVAGEGGSWSGTATELHERLVSDFKPDRSDELSKFVQNTAEGEPGLSCKSETERFKDEEGEWRSRRVLALALENGVTA